MINERGCGLNETAFILTKFLWDSNSWLVTVPLVMCSMPNGKAWAFKLTCKLKK